MHGSDGENTRKCLEPLWGGGSQASSFPRHFTGYHWPLSQCALGLSEVTGQILWELHSSVHPEEHKSTWFYGRSRSYVFWKVLSVSSYLLEPLPLFVVIWHEPREKTREFLHDKRPLVSSSAWSLSISLAAEKQTFASVLMFPFIPKMNFFSAPVLVKLCITCDNSF